MPELYPGVGACGRRPLRVRRPRLAGALGVRGGGGGLPELMLGSPKVILELSGVHFGLFEGHF